nr:AF4/FMR2 family member lilli isoform X1 [Drosophila suzukii]
MRSSRKKIDGKWHSFQLKSARIRMQELTRVCDLNGNAAKAELDPSAPTASNLEQLLPNIKLEHDPDLECWLPPEHPQLRLDLNSTRLLLQGSDDPLISHGATNDGHDEDHPFKTLLARKSLAHETPHNGTCSPLTKQQLKANLLMGSRKANRQPLQLEPSAPTPQKTVRPVPSQNRSQKRGEAGAMKLRFHHQALPAEYAAHYEATQGRKPSRPVLPPPTAPPPPSQAHENVRSWLRKIAEIQRSAERQQQKQSAAPRPPPGPPTSRSSPIAATSAVPVKSPEVATASKRSSLKYADLPYMGEITLDNYKPRRGRKPKKADICHLIYKNYGTIVPASVAAMPVSAAPPALTSTVSVPPEEPLNLCLRDQSGDRFSISSGDSEKPTTRTTPTTTTATTESSSHRTTPLGSGKPLTLELAGSEDQSLSAAKLMLQPGGLYYQQLVESCSLGGMAMPLETIEKDNQLSLKIPIPSGFFTNETAPLAMRKRKRSAIFIPPMPAEHSSSPSNEVSICKFKFTGGAKPTLQEKKMLSVDAEGNYRYYNGTGDKTMRGYEFISRDQQQQLQQNQQQGQQEKLFVDIPPPSTDLSPELLHISPESPTSTLLLPSSNHLMTAVAPQSPASQCSSSQSPMPGQTQAKSSSESDRKRRSSRRSKQREKLEKTFKEKGFLIQTQQLQSAEGATYCKFRQLKKFTRYLFRNWKDHIPESDLAKHQSGGREDNLPGGETQTT